MPETGSGVPELLKITEYGDAMGATYSVVLYGRDRAEMDAAVSPLA